MIWKTSRDSTRIPTKEGSLAVRVDGDPYKDRCSFASAFAGRWMIGTPLLVALVVIETTDIVFALDSIPAVLAMTRNPLIVYSSNVMAMLGLRSLYFVLSDAVYRMRYLRAGLAALLVFTAAKMLASEWVQVSPGVSVAIIAVVLLATIAASVWQKSTPVPAE
jgi:tellurite resistance protein TerC